MTQNQKVIRAFIEKKIPSKCSCQLEEKVLEYHFVYLRNFTYLAYMTCSHAVYFCTFCLPA